ncbi:MAG TPA: tautomerase family protein [Terriglobales bacterium]|nr:tautomerase family protein [Terriglobales bacterium]
MERVRDEQCYQCGYTEENYAHIILKTVPGKSEQEKTRLAEEITQAVMDVLHYDADSVSVAIEEIKPQDWAEKVYIPEILNSPEKLYKKPGYTMQKGN